MAGQVISPTLSLVIEIEPYAYSDRESPLTTASGPVSDEAFKKHLKDCLVDAGLDHLSPIFDDSPFYLIEQIDTPALRVLIEQEFPQWPEGENYNDVENINEYGSSLYGGVMITFHDNTISQPGCCCSLDCLNDWRTLVHQKPTQWTNLWTGHDASSIDARYVESTDCFTFRVGPWEKKQWDHVFELSRQALDQQMENWDQQLHRLSDRVAGCLTELVPGLKTIPAVANRIVGLA